MYRGKYERTPTRQANAAPVSDGSGFTPPARRKPASNKKDKKQKKPVTTGTKVFYSIFFAFVLAIVIGLIVLLCWLNGWLKDFEAAQPEHKSEEVFQEYFAEPDWLELYEIAPVEGDTFDHPQAYAAYMDDLMANATEINMVETSAGTSGKKYKIRAVFADDTYFDIADFTLVDKGTDSLNADWQLDEITLYVPSKKPAEVTPTYGYTFIIDPVNTVTVDDLVLDESYVIQTVTTAAESYLPEGVHGYRINTLYIGGLLEEAKEISVTDPNGAEIEMTYDEATRTYSQDLTLPEITDDARNAASKATIAYCKYMIKAISKGDLKQWFDPTTEIYATIAPDPFLQSYSNYTIDEPEITGYYAYTDDLFSVRVTTDVTLNRSNGEVKNYHMDTTLFMENQNGSWKVINMTNVDVQEQTTMIRLTYMVDEEVVFTEMIDQTSSKLTFPAISVPEGQSFLGWATKTQAANGDINYSLLFSPAAEGGSFTLSESYELAPLTLYALFQEVEAA